MKNGECKMTGGGLQYSPEREFSKKMPRVILPGGGDFLSSPTYNRCHRGNENDRGTPPDPWSMV
jgi:hypothetical protein